MTPTERRQALGHKAMNLYQVQMYQLEQSSELVTFEPDEIPTDYDYQTKIYVKNENLLYRLHQFGSQVKVGCMNFADPLTPGGNFMLGVNAQEEAICRNSFLYPELKKYRYTYYQQNKLYPNDFFYSPALIYANQVKVIRNEREDRIVMGRLVDFVTIAAPNVTAMKAAKIKLNTSRIYTDLENKILRTLRMFKNNAVTHLVLGAFGCGVFGNDPKMVAHAFKQVLARLEFQGAFAEIYFDILENPVAEQAFRVTIL